MRPPAFWAAGPDHPAARALAPVGAAYGALAARRMDRPGARACCPVLCLGNFTLGGAGKTPAALCRSLGADVVVMDDGLQNPSLAKDLSLAVIDGPAGLGNGLPFPAGPLRAPLARQWPHVGGLIVIGDGAGGAAVARAAERRGLPVHRARLVPETDDLAGRRCLAFAGIGRPEKFFATLAEAGAVIVGTRSYPDHHPYRARELVALAEAARRLDAELVTTEKDAVRLPRVFAAGVRILRVRLALDDAEALRRQIRGALSAP